MTGGASLVSKLTTQTTRSLLKLNGYARPVTSRRLMRRKYQDRRHITVYLDLAEYDKLRKAAGGDGKISEWARETLLGELEDNSDVRAERQVPSARRGTSAVERATGKFERPAEASEAAPLPKLCRHKLPNCTVCG